MFAQNLEVLRRRQPSVVSLLETMAEEGARRVRPAGDGPDAPLFFAVDDKAVPLAAGCPPGQAAATWIAGLEWDRIRHGILTCIGVGDGLHLEALAAHADPALDVMIVEPHSSLLAGVLHYRDLRGILDRDCTQVILDGTPIQLARRMAADAFGPKLLRLSTALLVHPAIAQYAPRFAEGFVHHLGVLANAASINRNTNTIKSATVLPHSCANLGAALASPGVAALAGKFAGVPAVVVSPGPSLEDDLPALRACRPACLVVAVDTALGPLRRAGVDPDLVVSIDMSARNARHFESMEVPPECRLVFEPMVHPSIPERFPGRRFVAVAWQPEEVRQPSGAFMRWVASLSVDFGRLIGLGSTSVAAFGLAVDLGCDPIVLVGQDLAYPEERRYAAGTVDVAPEEGRGEAVFTTNVKGQPVRTSPAFLLFRAQLERLVQGARRRVFNSSRRGAAIAGTLPLALADAVAGASAVSPSAGQRLREAADGWSPPDTGPIQEALEGIVAALATVGTPAAAADVLPAELRPVVELLLAAHQIAYDDASLQLRTAEALGDADGVRRARELLAAVRERSEVEALERLRTSLAEARARLVSSAGVG